MTHNLEKSWDELTDLINKSNSILLSTHVNPDGDGLGSEIGFYYHLKNMGKECRIINISGLYLFLGGEGGGGFGFFQKRVKIDLKQDSIQ